MIDENNKQGKIINDIVSDKGTSRKRVLGVSGTGKTFTIAKSVSSIINKKPNAKILITYYNMSLQWKILGELVKMDNLSSLSEEYFCVTKNEKVNCISNGKLPNIFVVHKDLFLYHANPAKISFDYIFVDEGQDFGQDDIKKLIEFLSAPNSKLCFFADKRQHLYGYNKYAPQEEAPGNKAPALEGCGFRGKWNELDTVYRSSGLIQQLAEEYASKMLLAYGTGGTPINEFDRSNGVVFYTQSVDSQYLLKYIKLFLINKKWDINKTALILPDNNYVANAAAFFKHTHCTFDKTCENKDKYKRRERIQSLRMDFCVVADGLKISTIESFKGLEIENVIFYHNTVDGTSPSTEKDLERCYVALSRATQRLLIIDADICSPLHDIYEKYSLPSIPNFQVKRLKVKMEGDDDNIPW